MSQEIPMVHTGPLPEESVDENERLRIRKNCKCVRIDLSLATHAHIPPRSPELVPPHVDDSDEKCKPVNLPRPIYL